MGIHIRITKYSENIDVLHTRYKGKRRYYIYVDGELLVKIEVEERD